MQDRNTNKNASRPLRRSDSRPLNTSASRPLGNNHSRPLGGNASRPLGEANFRPLGESHSRPLSDNRSRSFGESASRPINAHASRPLDGNSRPLWEGGVSRSLRDDTASRPLGGNASRPLRDSVSMPVSGSASRPLRESHSIRLNADANQAQQHHASHHSQPLSTAAAADAAQQATQHTTQQTAHQAHTPHQQHPHSGAKPTYRQAGNPHAQTSARYHNDARYRASASVKRKINGRIVGIAAGACALIAAIVVVVLTFAPVEVTVNGQPVSVGGGKTLADAVEASGVTTQPGDLVSVEGVVLQKGAGEAFHGIVNGEDPSDASRRLASGDVIVVENGHNVEEPSSVEEVTLPFSAEIEGTGALHSKVSDGVDGVQQIKKGELSGKTATATVQEPVNAKWRRYNADVHGEKVIALTFDDGPNSSYTTQILDILKENDAKCTFFTVGTCITGDNVAVLQRASSEGHQISTHSFDHAAGSGQGVNLGYMTPEEMIQEIQKGNQAISDTGVAPAAEIFRTPGGNFGETVIATLSPYVTDEIGWNIDTHDWQRPGVDTIKQRIAGASPGEIVLMHDGGGDRSQTVQALREALPELKAQGFRFVTIQELLGMAK